MGPLLAMLTGNAQNQLDPNLYLLKKKTHPNFNHTDARNHLQQKLEIWMAEAKEFIGLMLMRSQKRAITVDMLVLLRCLLLLLYPSVQ